MWKRIWEKVEPFRPPLPGDQPEVFPGAGDRVVLLHGLWRSHKAMALIGRDLNANGFEVVNVPYRSFVDPLDDIVDQVRGHLERLAPKATHFVTHSMGGIVVRRMAQRFPELVQGRVVMLAPPNHGSEVMDWLSDVPGIRWVLGPGGLALGTQEVVQELPSGTPSPETAVIMGCRSINPVFRQFLPGDNDGTVTVEGGRLDDLEHFSVCEVGHARVMLQPEVVDLVRAFLQEGRFSEKQSPVGEKSA